MPGVRHHAAETCAQDIGLDAECQQAEDRTDGVGGADAAEHQIAGQRGAGGKSGDVGLGRVRECDDVAVLRQGGAQRVGSVRARGPVGAGSLRIGRCRPGQATRSPGSMDPYPRIITKVGVILGPG